MTTKAAGRIIIYSDDGEIHRWVDADDVAALEHQVAELRHDLAYYMYGAGQDAARIASLEQAYRVAQAIMRSNPVGVPVRLVKAWQAAAVKVEGKR
jgi:nucleoside-diphosphate-sugar epimerase